MRSHILDRRGSETRARPTTHLEQRREAGDVHRVKQRLAPPRRAGGLARRVGERERERGADEAEVDAGRRAVLRGGAADALDDRSAQTAMRSRPVLLTPLSCWHDSTRQ